MSKGMGFLLVVAALLLVTQTSPAQFKSQVEQSPSVLEGLYRPSTGFFLFDWFNPANFQMHQSVEMSFQSFGGKGVSLGTYTNSMSYKFADNLNARADISLSYSPYSSFSSPLNGGKNNLSSLYLSRLQMDYQPWKNVFLQVQYRQLPPGSYLYSPFMSPWERGYGY